MKKILFVLVVGCFSFNMTSCSEDELVADTPSKKASLHQLDCMGKKPTQAQLDDISKVWDDYYKNYPEACKKQIDDILVCFSKLECNVFDDSDARADACDAQIKAAAQCDLDNGVLE